MARHRVGGRDGRVRSVVRFAGDAWAIVVSGVLYTMASNLFSNAYHVYLADSYPTAIRGTAAGAAYSLSKLTTGVLPFILLPFLDANGSGPVFALVAAVMVALMVNVGVLGHRRRVSRPTPRSPADRPLGGA